MQSLLNSCDAYNADDVTSEARNVPEIEIPNNSLEEDTAEDIAEDNATTTNTTMTSLNLNNLGSSVNSNGDRSNSGRPRWHFNSNGGRKILWRRDSNESADGRSPVVATVSPAARSARMSLPMSDDMRSRENRLTRISLCIVWLFIFCHVWKLIPTLYEGWNSDEEFKGASQWPQWLTHINDVSHTLIVFNSAVNFLIYVAL